MTRRTAPSLLPRTLLAASILATVGPAFAQDNISTSTISPTTDNVKAKSRAPSNADANTKSLDQVVVTGNASITGVKKLDASYSITTLTADQISQANTTSANDLLKASPGVHVESSGGQTGANIEVAGFPGSGQSPYVTLGLQGVPFYPMSGLAYLEQASLLRLDDTIERAELVQGGPAVLYGSAQPGLFGNFILKQGTDVTSGDVGMTIGSEDLVRLDGFVGFPLSKNSNWYGSVGGFYRQSSGVRNPEYLADDGGQITATLTRDWDSGSLMFFARYINDKNQFVTDTPILNPSRGQFSNYPGFSPLTGTMGSKADQYEFLQTTPCFTKGCTPGGIAVNMANGRGPDAYLTGANFDWDFGNGWTISDKLGVNGGTENMVAFYSTGTNPLPLSTFIANAESANHLPAGLTANATYTTGGQASMSQNVVTQELRYVQQKFHAVSNEFHVNKELFEGNTLTLGNYTVGYNSNELAIQGSDILLQAKNNPTPIAVSLTNGTQTWQVASPQGFTTGPTTAQRIPGTGFNTAFFLSDTWKLDNWLFDAGIRDEYQHLRASLGNVATGDLDDNPYTLYNNKSRYLVPGSTAIRYGKTAPSWTIGANYAFDEHMSAYARLSDGVHFPSFTDLATLPNTPVEKMHNMEIGFKYEANWIYADISAFRRLFSGVPSSLLVAVGNTTETVSYVYGSQSKGVNFNVTAKPIDHLSINLSGNYQDSQYTHSNGCYTYQGETTQVVCSKSNQFNGYQLARQPTFQARLTPSYEIPTSWGSLTAWVTYEYIGSHYSDQQELQPLGHYYDLAFGVVANVGKEWAFTLQGTNVTNQIGLTEGNARILGAANTGGVILARSIEGREVNFQAKYKF
ncbi:TonB-dependent receptor [Dyella nitratireducens]|uniref:TonB-dependent receptor n=1 Tax=Dyella nitratireducens TaxID=1849580 RepID=A0ABQ1GA46_9GAMM|nr:TonB-dependent receptor [Dyella nitratireducens]GGA39636.1 TonB-dependent receptor [Dyella nitratireducens]GLQ40466.1 TonB-dependent receptor [Dyella nitratireducens]